MTEHQHTPTRQTSITEETITIVQYNVQVSKDVMTPLLQQAAREGIQILAIQEPWINKSNRKTENHQDYWCGMMTTGIARTAFYIHKSIHQEHWSIEYHTGDITTLKLQLKERTIHIHNICNPGPGQYSATRAITLCKLQQIIQESQAECITLGNFNLHHEKWNKPDRTTKHKDADKLLDIANKNHWILATPKGLTTWSKGNQRTTIDLAFMSPGIYPALTKCNKMDSLDYNSDHFPIATSILTRTLPKTNTKRRQWKRANWPKIKEQLKTDMLKIQNPTTKEGIDHTITSITSAIHRATDQHVPWAKPSPKANPAWTQEVERLVREARKARRKATSLDPWDVADYKRIMNQKKQALRRGRTYAWRSFTAEITKGKGIWKMVKWAKTKADEPQTTPQFPPLQR